MIHNIFHNFKNGSFWRNVVFVDNMSSVKLYSNSFLWLHHTGQHEAGCVHLISRYILEQLKSCYASRVTTNTGAVRVRLVLRTSIIYHKQEKTVFELQKMSKETFYLGNRALWKIQSEHSKTYTEGKKKGLKALVSLTVWHLFVLEIHSLLPSLFLLKWRKRNCTQGWHWGDVELIYIYTCPFISLWGSDRDSDAFNKNQKSSWASHHWGFSSPSHRNKSLQDLLSCFPSCLKLLMLIVLFIK